MTLEAAEILLEAHQLITGDRQHDYGHPLDDFSRTALIWSAILGTHVDAEQVALCLVGVKISREVNHPKRDNAVDGAGYFGTLQMVKEERARRAAERRRHIEPIDFTPAQDDIDRVNDFIAQADYELRLRGE